MIEGISFNYVFCLAVLQVMWIDVLLSGDNAIVVAMVCRDLPEKTRRVGLVLGVALAIILRLILASFITALLAVPFIKVVAGIALLWIAVKLVYGEGDGSTHRTRQTLLAAVGTIAAADLSMSIDNVVAIAAAARGDYMVFIIGLIVSIPLMIVGASIVSATISRFPILLWAGAALLGWIAGAMIGEDASVVAVLPDHHLSHLVHPAAGTVGAVAVVVVGLSLLALRRSRQAQTQKAYGD